MVASTENQRTGALSGIRVGRVAAPLRELTAEGLVVVLKALAAESAAR